MRRLLLVLGTVGLLFVLAACGESQTQSEQESASSSQQAGQQTRVRTGKVRDVKPEPVPDIALETLDGQSIHLAQRDGEVLLINFWATWCAPCREEIPELKELHANQENITVIGVSLDRKGAEVVKPFVKKESINYPIVIDTEGTAESQLGPVYGLPTTVVVAPNGQITKRVVGIVPVDEMMPTFKKMLETDSST